MKVKLNKDGYILEGEFVTFNNQIPCNSRIYDEKVFRKHLDDLKRRMTYEQREKKLRRVLRCPEPKKEQPISTHTII